MDKISIQPLEIKSVEFDYNGQMVEVKPYMSVNEKATLIEVYLFGMFEDKENKFLSNTESDRLRADYQLMLMVIDKFTNINLQELDLDKIYLDDLFYEVTKRIYGWIHFKNLLYAIVNDYQKDMMLKHSLGKVIEELSEKLLNILSTFSELSPESIKELSNSASELLKQTKDIANPDKLLFEKSST
jgi:hypothetical protein